MPPLSGVKHRPTTPRLLLLLIKLLLESKRQRAVGFLLLLLRSRLGPATETNRR